MRRLVVIVAALAFALAGAHVSASQEGGPAGALHGTARDGKGHKLARSTVRVRNAATGAIVAEVVSDAAGAFTVAGLAPATYVVEIVSATGEVLGVSAAVTVTPAATATVTVAATAAGAIAAAAGGLSVLGLGTATSAAVIGAAGAAAYVAVRELRPVASPSR